MKNAGEIRIAARYVSALFDVAKAASALGDVEKNLNDLMCAAKDSNIFAEFVSTPLLGAQQQADIVAVLAEKIAAHAVTKSFLLTLATQRRLALLVEITKQFNVLSEKERGELSAQLITATAVSQADMQVISERLGKIYGKKIKLTGTQDKHLIGGAIVKIGSLQLDSSLAGKLSRMEQRLKAA